tara:strand:- start:28 stop:777 length:750 start_codon:yes stop_codon:yes gene_type:complete
MNFIKKICYKLLCKIYRFNIGIWYKFKFRKFEIKNLESECLKYTNKANLNDILDLDKKEIIKSLYQETFIFNDKEIMQLLRFIFDEEFKKFLQEKNNCCFSVDFLSIYKNKYLTFDESLNSIYANLFHIDKPFSKYTLKVFIPVNVKSDEFGPLEVKVINPLKESKKYKGKEYIKLFAENKHTNIFLFNPSQNYHRACVPKEKKVSINIIFQLNPSRYWSYSSQLYKRQFKVEPNFPEIRNFNSKRIKF